MNASNDKEFVQNELRKKIVTLEKQIEDLRKDHGEEKSKLLEQQRETVSKLEEQIRLLK
jgi:ribosome-binding ATPase YchF (GTP1/OBG family)